jgi:hypothetical protein
MEMTGAPAIAIWARSIPAPEMTAIVHVTWCIWCQVATPATPSTFAGTGALTFVVTF